MKTETVELDEKEWWDISELLNNAFNQIIGFRTQEGKSVEVMLNEKLNSISQLLEQIDQYDGERVAKIKQRLEENLLALEEKVSIDRNRLEQELIFYIEKLDVNEEKVRLKNHIAYFAETMQNEHNPGKKLGFIAQEMGREINTLGSKSNQSGARVTPLPWAWHDSAMYVAENNYSKDWIFDILFHN